MTPKNHNGLVARTGRTLFTSTGTRVYYQSQPALASPERLEILEALAGVAAAPEVELLDILVGAERPTRAIEHDSALLHDVTVVGHLQGHVRILLNQQHGDAELAVEALDDREHLLHE